MKAPELEYRLNFSPVRYQKRREGLGGHGLVKVFRVFGDTLFSTHRLAGYDLYSVVPDNWQYLSMETTD